MRELGTVSMLLRTSNKITVQRSKSTILNSAFRGFLVKRTMVEKNEMKIEIVNSS